MLEEFATDMQFHTGSVTQHHRNGCFTRYAARIAFAQQAKHQSFAIGTANLDPTVFADSQFQAKFTGL